GLRPGMRALTPAEGFPELPPCRIGLLRNPHNRSRLAEALAGHIISSLDNLSQGHSVAAE
ncbi:MAG: LysR family transcriptional regulator, partial [Rhodoplanes sp.]